MKRAGLVCIGYLGVVSFMLYNPALFAHNPPDPYHYTHQQTLPNHMRDLSNDFPFTPQHTRASSETTQGVRDNMRDLNRIAESRQVVAVNNRNRCRSVACASVCMIAVVIVILLGLHFGRII